MELGCSLIIKTLSSDYTSQMGLQRSSRDGESVSHGWGSTEIPCSQGSGPQAVGQGPKFREET